eukprot:g12469.t1
MADSFVCSQGTYTIEEAGEIPLDDLSGIKNYNDVCESTGVREYDETTDKGVGTSFWNGAWAQTPGRAPDARVAGTGRGERFGDQPSADPKKGKHRVKHITRLFAKRFPQSETWVNPWPVALDMPGSVRLVRLACGLKHTLFLTASGELFGCGQNAQRQLSNAVSGCVSTTPLPFSEENGQAVEVFCHASLNVSVVLTKENRFFICGEAGSLFNSTGLIEQFLAYDRDAVIVENHIVCLKPSAGQVHVPGFNDPEVCGVELVAAKSEEAVQSDAEPWPSLRRLALKALEAGQLTAEDVIHESGGEGSHSAATFQLKHTVCSFTSSEDFLRARSENGGGL